MDHQKASKRVCGRLGPLVVLALVSGSAFADGTPDFQNGKNRYEETCVACHGENGRGTIAGIPDFTSSKGPLQKSEDILLANIRDGLDRPEADMAMPPMGANPDLSEDDLRDILHYMLKAFKRR